MNCRSGVSVATLSVPVGEASVRLTASFGVAGYGPGVSCDELLARARTQIRRRRYHDKLRGLLDDGEQQVRFLLAVADKI